MTWCGSSRRASGGRRVVSAVGLRGVGSRGRRAAAAPAWRGVGAAAGLTLALALLSGCAAGVGSQEGDAVAWAVAHTYAEGGVEARLRLDRDRITTAERARLEVEVLAREGRAVQLPTAEEAGAGDLTVGQVRTLPPALAEGGRVRWIRQFELQPFLAGPYQVPSLVVDVGEGGGERPVTLHTDAIPVHVTSVLAGGEEMPALREVEGPVAAPPRLGRLVLFAALGLVAASVAAASVVLLRRGAARARSEVVIIPPHEAALRALLELASGDLLQRDPLAFHTAVADILRDYLEQRFGVRAPERTTEELMLILAAGSWLDDAQRRALHAFLAQCDQVKFARARPSVAASRGLLDTANELVLATRPRAQEPAAELEAAGAV